MWRRAMDYLGLNGEETYDDYDMSEEYDRPARGPRHAPEPPMRGRGGYADEYDPDYGRPSSRPIPRHAPEPPMRRAEESGVHVRPVGAPRPGGAQRSQTVRAYGGPSAEPVTVRPREYNDAQEVADHFKEGQPVIINLEGADSVIARRIVDFASGMCYALSGTMERVANGVYLLKPPPSY